MKPKRKKIHDDNQKKKKIRKTRKKNEVEEKNG